jgi:preprotein translocase SecE subunit
VDRIRRLGASIRRSIDEAWSELKKVTWPTLAQTRSLTVLVFVVSLGIGLFITFFDAIFLNGVKFVSNG